MAFFEDTMEKMIWEGLLDRYADSFGMVSSEELTSQGDARILYNRRTGRWYAVGIGPEKTGRYSIEIPFDQKLIPALLMMEYCAPAEYMDKDSWVSLLIDARIPYQTYTILMERSFRYMKETDHAGINRVREEKHAYTGTAIPERGTLRSSDIPETIVKLINEYDPRRTKEENFYRQAAIAADYTDSFPQRSPVRTGMPSYHDMTVSQLRGYFGWRTELRENGMLDEHTPPVYLKLYVFELLSLLHGDAAASFEQLAAVEEMQMTKDGMFALTLKGWIDDFVLYCDLPEEYFARRFGTRETDAFRILKEADEKADGTEEKLISAFRFLTGRKIQASAFLSEHEEDALRVMVRAYLQLSADHRPAGKSWFRRMFTEVTLPHRMFSGALFFEKEKHPDAEYWISDRTVCTCREGEWKLSEYIPARDWEKMAEETDRLLREAYGHKRKLKYKGIDKEIQEALKAAVDSLMKEKAEAARPVIRIDMSSLSAIRTAAAATRETLLTEEETEINEEAQESGKHEETAEGLFSEEEARFLRVLLAGGQPDERTRTQAAVLSDGINEKMMDEIGDTVIEFAGDTPTLIEDYRQDLEGILAETGAE